MTIENKPFDPIDKFVQRVLKELIEKFGYEETHAYDLIAQSYFIEVIADEPNYVLHYSPLYWAKEIYEDEHSLVSH